MLFSIDQANDGRVLRGFLQELGVSAALCARLKRSERGMLLNGCRVSVRAVLHAGDTLELAIEDDAPSCGVVPRPLPLEVLLETDGMLVLNKPANMPTHPSHGHFEDTLANALVYHYSTESTPFVPRFINRLDRNTTGAVLVARHALAAASLSRAMAEGRIRKTYLALVHGRLESPVTLRTGIRRRAESIIFREVCAVGEGDLAITQVTPLFVGECSTLVRLTPQTGRTHQLRVHMAHIGHPLLGDDLYGGPEEFGRHALHAATLTLPVSGKEITVCAPLPEDMRRYLKALGKGALQLAEQETEHKGSA